MHTAGRTNRILKVTMLWILVAVGLVDGGTSNSDGGGGGGLCEGINCSGHGTCYEVAGDPGFPVCVCDPGYTAQNKTQCVPTDVDPCLGQKCSDHGQCKVVDGTAQCDCESGYQAEDLVCLPAEAPSCSCSVSDTTTLSMPDSTQVDGVASLDGSSSLFFLMEQIPTPGQISLVRWDPAQAQLAAPIVLQRPDVTGPDDGSYVSGFAAAGDHFIVLFALTNKDEHGTTFMTSLVGYKVAEDGTQSDPVVLWDGKDALGAHAFVLGSHVFVGSPKLTGSQELDDCGTMDLYVSEFDDQLQPVGTGELVWSEPRRPAHVWSSYACYGAVFVWRGAVGEDGKPMLVLRSPSVHSGSVGQRYRFAVQGDDGWQVGDPLVASVDSMFLDDAQFAAGMGGYLFSYHFPGRVEEPPAQAEYIDRYGTPAGGYYGTWDMDEQNQSSALADGPGLLWVGCTFVYAASMYNSKDVFQENVATESFTSIKHVEGQSRSFGVVRWLSEAGDGTVWWLYPSLDNTKLFATQVTCQ